jgi:fructan beta-fructosidase
MAVYDEFEKKQWIAFYTSPDLKEWTFASRIEGFFECPDLVEMPLLPDAMGQDGPTRWALYAADGKYLIGDFDGKTFMPAFKKKKQLWYGRFYAAQTFDNAPYYVGRVSLGPPVQHLRRVQIGWAQGVTFPGTPFNQQMTVPVDLRLYGKDEPVLRAKPIDELEDLREREPVRESLRGTEWTRDAGTNTRRATLGDKLDAFDLSTRVTPGKTKELTFDLRGTKLVYDVAKETLTCKDVTAPAKLRDGTLVLRVLVDRGSIEVFVNWGEAAMSVAAIPDEKNHKAEVSADAADVTFDWVILYRLKSAWQK